MLIQPYPFFDSIRIVTSNSYDLTEFELPVNDLLTVISVLRIYVFIRAGLILTPYQNTRCTQLRLTQQIDCAKCMDVRLTLVSVSNVCSRTTPWYWLGFSLPSAQWYSRSRFIWLKEEPLYWLKLLLECATIFSTLSGSFSWPLPLLDMEITSRTLQLGESSSWLLPSGAHLSCRWWS